MKLMDEQTLNQGINQQASDIFNRVKGIITKPVEEWQIINSEKPDIKQVITSYVLPLVIISSICTILGYALIGDNTYYGLIGVVNKSGWLFGIREGIISIISSVAAVFVSALIINALAASFKSEQNFGKSFHLVSYSFTPLWIGGLLSIVPSISWIGALIGFYGLYLMYLGMMPLMKTPKDQTAGYLIISILVTILSYFLISLIMGFILAFILIV